MSSSIDILLTIEEEENCNTKKLAKKLGISTNTLEQLLRELSEKNVVEYDPKSGRVKLSQWLINLNNQIEDTKPATGAIILPKNQELKLEDIILGNFTEADLELKIRFAAKQKEIAICEIS